VYIFGALAELLDAAETPRVAADPAVVTSNAVAMTVMAAAALPTPLL
jgi:hypothetical protein